MLCQLCGHRARLWLAQVSGCKWKHSGKPLAQLLQEDKVSARESGVLGNAHPLPLSQSLSVREAKVSCRLECEHDSTKLEWGGQGLWVAVFPSVQSHHPSVIYPPGSQFQLTLLVTHFRFHLTVNFKNHGQSVSFGPVLIPSPSQICLLSNY